MGGFMGKQKSGRKGRGAQRPGASAQAPTDFALGGFVGPPGRDHKKILTGGAEPPLATIVGPPGQSPSRHRTQGALALADDFVYDLNQKRTRFSDQVLLDQIRRVASRSPAVPLTCGSSASQCPDTLSFLSRPSPPPPRQTRPPRI